MNLAKRILKNTTIDIASTLEDSIFFQERDMITTPVPMVNVALSGRLDGGLSSGVTVLAGPSKNFKSGFALLLASAYMKKYKDSALLFYDSEFGTPQNYFEMFSIPMDRVIHTPVTDIYELQHDIINQLKGIERGDKLVIIIDSLGSLASVKEIEDAESGKQVADMTRAKNMKSLFRMITPRAGLKDIPIIVVNHTYKEIGLYPRDIVSGGTGAYYSADTIWIVGRQQDRNGAELKGYNFVINVEKSRFVKEKSKIPINVSFDKGIQKWAGLFDVAEEVGIIHSPSKGWYMLTYSKDISAGREGTKFRRAEVEYDNDFWVKVLAETPLSAYIRDKYQLSTEDIVDEDA
jgi:RecA/RadA recombinase